VNACLQDKRYLYWRDWTRLGKYANKKCFVGLAKATTKKRQSPWAEMRMMFLCDKQSKRRERIQRVPGGDANLVLPWLYCRELPTATSHGQVVAPYPGGAW
jgi:hypothetical protein